jgi:hypothetical protein
MERNLPTFLVVGAAKCGTTSLASYLAAHPQIFMCPRKEPNFFSFRWEKGVDWYRELFGASEGYRAVGEATVAYSMAPQVPDVPRRIASVIPDVRIVYLIRHPIERIRSHYRFRVYRGKERARSLIEAMVRDPGYVRVSSYAYQLERYLEHFPRERILVVSSEGLRNRRRETMAEVFGFLGVDDRIAPPNLETELHRSKDMGRVPSWLEKPRQVWHRVPWLARQVPHGLRRRLRWRLTYRAIPLEALEIRPDIEATLLQELRPDLERLRGIVGPDFDLWGLA